MWDTLVDRYKIQQLYVQHNMVYIYFICPFVRYDQENCMQECHNYFPILWHFCQLSTEHHKFKGNPHSCTKSKHKSHRSPQICNIYIAVQELSHIGRKPTSLLHIAAQSVGCHLHHVVVVVSFHACHVHSLAVQSDWK